MADLAAYSVQTEREDKIDERMEGIMYKEGTEENTKRKKKKKKINERKRVVQHVGTKQEEKDRRNVSVEERKRNTRCQGK